MTETSPRLCVVGPGSIGGLVTGRLALAMPGHVSALARGATLAALRTRGIRLDEGDGATRDVPVAASDDPAALGPQDMIFLCTKAGALPGLATRLAPMLHSGTVIVPMLNGVPWWFFAGYGGALNGRRLEAVDPGGLVSAHLPPRQVVGAVVHLAASSPEPGVVTRTAGNRLILGAVTTDGPSPEPVRDILARAGFAAEVAPDIRREVWYKLWGNLSFNPVSALSRATADRIGADPEVRLLCRRMMEEAAAVSARFGLRIESSVDDRLAVAARLGRFKTSMLQDAEAGRPLEVGGLLGAVVEIAEAVGEDVPFTRAVFGLARLLSEGMGEATPAA